MQQASKTTAARTSTLAITGAQTLANAESYLNTLALQGCQTVVGAGELPDQAIKARASAFPRTRFIAVTTTAAAQTAANLTLLPGTTPTAVSSGVEKLLLTGSAAHTS